MISSQDLRHHRMLAAIRENSIPEDELKYLGIIDESHTYLIDGKHIVKLENIIDFEEVDDPESDSL